MADQLKFIKRNSEREKVFKIGFSVCRNIVFQ